MDLMCWQNRICNCSVGMFIVNALAVRQKGKWLELALLNRLMLPKDYYSIVDVFAFLGLTKNFLALHAKNFRWCDGWCEESITFFTYSYCMEGSACEEWTLRKVTEGQMIQRRV